jgi:ecotin
MAKEMRSPLVLAILTVCLVALAIPVASGDDQKYLKAFPPAEDGMVRYVIELPHKERGEDNGFEIEIIVGKEMLTDGANQYRLGGKIEAMPLKGWGFTYYEVESFGPTATTRIGVPPGTPQVKKFVSMPSLKIRYNSRIPLVVYVPEGGEVRYRIWAASETTEKAPKG